MTQPVVDRLQAVHVDEGGYQVSFRAPRAVDLVLEVLQPHTPPARPGQIVGARVEALARGQLTVVRGPVAVDRGLPASFRRPLAVFEGAPARLGGTRPDVFYAQRLLVI